jgi:hypothetical protein
VDNPGLDKFRGNSQSRLEVDLLFFAQDGSVTDLRYRTETYRKYERGDDERTKES